MTFLRRSPVFVDTTSIVGQGSHLLWFYAPATQSLTYELESDHVLQDAHILRLEADPKPGHS